MIISYIDPSIYDKIFEDFSEEDSNYIEEILNRNISRRSKILKGIDIGCGTGRIGRILSKKFYIIGLDIDINMLRIAKSRIDVICCEISQIPIRSRSIDFAYSWLATLNYLNYVKLREHMKEINRILRERSTYIIDMVLESYDKDHYEELWNFNYNSKRCIFNYSVRRLERGMWLETFRIICDDLYMEKSFITYVYSYQLFKNVVNDYFNIMIYRPFTFNKISRPAGRCIIVLKKRRAGETVL